MGEARNRSNHLICGIGGTSLANVAVILAALFLLGAMTAPPSNHGSGVYLPRVGYPVSMERANREDAIVIAVTRDRKFFFHKDPVPLAQLPARIQEEVSHGAEKKVYIKADARARYGWVSQVLDSARAAGIAQIGFLVEQRQRLPSAAQ